MAFPSYRPLTQNDHKFGILTMATGAAWFTIIAATHDETKPSAEAGIFWPAVTSSFLLLFGGFLWLVLDSWYRGRAWFKLLLGGSGASVGGAAQWFGFTGLLPLAIGTCAWTAATAVELFRADSMAEPDGLETLAKPLAECSDGASRKPIDHDSSRNAQLEKQPESVFRS